MEGKRPELMGVNEKIYIPYKSLNGSYSNWWKLEK